MKKSDLTISTMEDKPDSNDIVNDESSEDLQTNQPIVQEYITKIPNGGYGWIVLIASFVC